MSKPVIVIGSGGHARVVIEALLASGASLLGAVDSDPARIGAELLGLRVLGTDELLLKDYAPSEVELACGVGSIAPSSRRAEIYRGYRARGYVFRGVIHPSAVIARDARIAQDAQVMAGALLQPGVRVGDNAILNTGCCVDHDCDIGEHVHVSPGATLCGAVQVGAGAHVGAGATVIQGISIGAGAFVYAGAVVTRDVAALTRVAGTPAREISA